MFHLLDQRVDDLLLALDFVPQVLGGKLALIHDDLLQDVVVGGVVEQEVIHDGPGDTWERRDI